MPHEWMSIIIMYYLWILNRKNLTFEKAYKEKIHLLRLQQF